MIPTDLDAFFTTNADRIRAELFELLRIPSVSTRSEHGPDLQRAAEWLAASMRAAGLAAVDCPRAGAGLLAPNPMDRAVSGCQEGPAPPPESGSESNGLR
jgi:acetylornithine deacetylase/succinyl-diaminopimelate desuccinylase-like protein